MSTPPAHALTPASAPAPTPASAPAGRARTTRQLRPGTSFRHDDGAWVLETADGERHDVRLPAAETDRLLRALREGVVPASATARSALAALVVAGHASAPPLEPAVAVTVAVEDPAAPGEAVAGRQGADGGGPAGRPAPAPTAGSDRSAWLAELDAATRAALRRAGARVAPSGAPGTAHTPADGAGGGDGTGTGTGTGDTIELRILTGPPPARPTGGLRPPPGRVEPLLTCWPEADHLLLAPAAVPAVDAAARCRATSRRRPVTPAPEPVPATGLAGDDPHRPSPRAVELAATTLALELLRRAERARLLGGTPAADRQDLLLTRVDLTALRVTQHPVLPVPAASA